MSKDWKEKNKLDDTTKLVIIINVVIAIFNIYVAIKTKQISYITISILFLTIACNQYLDAKLLKSKDYLLHIKNETIDKQEKTIKILFKELEKKTKIIDIKNINIPDYFKKPNKKKMEEREKYFRQNSKFEAPIIIDQYNNLIDGYTSYLIAKKYEFSTVEVQQK